MKRKITAMILVGCALGCLLPACYLDPKKGYPGPELPKTDLALIVQTENLEYRPIYMRIQGPDGTQEIQIDDLGVAVLPGAYDFRARVYHSRMEERRRVATMPVVPGKSDFPVEEPVMRWVRGDTPYKETEDVTFRVEAGYAYGVWCSDDDQISLKVLGPYQ